MNKKLTAAGLAAGLLAGTGAGLILEMSGAAGASGTNTSAVSAAGDTTDTAATTDTADDSSTRLQEVLKPLVDDGTLTQAQLDKVVETLAAAGPMGGAGRGDHGGGRGGAGLGVVATTLGMTEAEVRDAISNGQTLAQLAESKGSSAQTLIDAILADTKTHLDEEVAAGEHTQAEADAKLADATTRVTDFVNNTDTAGPMGGGMDGGMGGPGGHHGHRDGDAPGTVDTATDATATDGTGTQIDGGPADTTVTTGA
jgi:hypothetical protein